MDSIFGVKDKDKFTCVNFACGQFADEVTLCIGEDQEIKIDGNKITIVAIKPKYPETYEACCKITEDVADASLTCFACKLLNDFQKLLLCRDAYWEIAGEQMGLGEPWEPKYKSLVDNTFFTIQTFNGEVDKSGTSHRNAVLAFPTVEMRDAFYENFKDLIKQCKELL